MNRRNIYRILSIVLIVGGIGLAFFPVADYYRIKYYNAKLLKAYEDDIQLQEKADENSGLILEVLEEFEEMSTEEVTWSEEHHTEGVTATTKMPETTAKPRPKPKLNVIGVIEIPRIDLKLPILDKVTETNLNYGTAHIEGTNRIGEVGNVGIAGHRGRSRGLLFNRLGEVEEGDVIMIKSDGKTYEYTIYSVSIVEPSDVSVLNRSRTEKVLTLVTCDPVSNPTHRLIVHALQKPE